MIQFLGSHQLVSPYIFSEASYGTSKQHNSAGKRLSRESGEGIRNKELKTPNWPRAWARKKSFHERVGLHLSTGS